MNKTNRIRLLTAAAMILGFANLSPSRADLPFFAPFTPGVTYAIGSGSWGFYPDSTSPIANCELNIPHKIQVVKQTSEKNGNEWVYFKVIPTAPLRARECTAEKIVRMSIASASTMRNSAAEYSVFKADLARILAGKGTIKSRDHVRVGDEIEVRQELYATVANQTIAHSLRFFRESDGCRINKDEKVKVLGFLAHPGPFGPRALLKFEGANPDKDAGRCPTGVIYAEYLDFSQGDYARPSRN